MQLDNDDTFLKVSPAASDHLRAAALDHDLFYTREVRGNSVRDTTPSPLDMPIIELKATRLSNRLWVSGIVPRSPAMPRASCKHTTSCASVTDAKCRHLARLLAASPPIVPKSKAQIHMQAAIGAIPDHGAAENEGAPGWPPTPCPHRGHRQASVAGKSHHSSAATLTSATTPSTSIPQQCSIAAVMLYSLLR